ncbi:MAG TPA: hypothetical protein VK461_03740 [Acidimicrobiales bacterium]|nr:hypothetical protein [Acidimicrobiales bacterium]
MISKRSLHAIRILLVAGAIAALALTACGSDSPTTSAAGSAPASTSAGTTAAPVATTEVTPKAASPDEKTAEAALLTGSDVGDGWSVVDAKWDFPNSAALAATIPECADFVDLVFGGGARHGVGVSRTLGSDTDLVFTYSVVFPNADDAAAMIAAVGSPAFDTCWIKYNEVAAVKMPFGVSEASYTTNAPPNLTFTADSSAVKSLDGSVNIGGTEVHDTCVCVFAQAGRGVVEVHSPAGALDPATRSAVVQAAIDHMRSALSG